MAVAQKLADFSRPRARYLATGTMSAAFERQVMVRPEAIAVTCGRESLSYDALNRRANRLAHRLRGAGVGPETLVGLCAERSLDLVVGVLGIVKAGGAYLPIDLSYPTDRVAFMLEDAEAALLLTQRHLAPRLPAGRTPLLFLDDEGRGESETNLEGGAGPENLIYTIYTSGSTGRPKGALLTHHAVDRLFRATEGLFGFAPTDVWTLFHSIAFDFSVWEFWGALAHGGRLVLVPYDVSRAPEAFLDLVRREGVTVLNQTPSAFAQLVRADVASGAPRPTALRWVIFGGEALDVVSLRPWFERHGWTSPTLVNGYGITETCVFVSFHTLTPADLDRRGPASIGAPMPDLVTLVADGEGRVVGHGEPGELLVGGPGLARGYLKRPELTAERFVPDPARAGERLYRSGDLVQRDGDGYVYLGRIDQQVKISGFRIELGEIRSVLGGHPDVRDAVVLARPGTEGEQRLVAYIIPKAGAAAAPPDLRRHLLASLPEYMVPERFVGVESFPLTSNGKLDVDALPAPSRERPELDRPYRPPRGALEQLVARLWCEVLGLDRVGRDDRFFDLGGTSLRAVRFAALLSRELGVRVPVVALFEAPTVATVAEVVTRDYADAAAAVQGTSARRGTP
jgi:amino acid adenylation domain-containing protein